MSEPEAEALFVQAPPRAIRVKTSAGWADLAIQGAPGAPSYPATGGKEGQVLTVPTPAAAPIWQAPAPGSDLNYDGDFAAGPTYKDGEIVVYQDASGNKTAYICVTPTSSPPTAWPGGPPPVPAYPRPSYGTTLPASPTDGQEHVLVDSVTAPTYQWRFRYNASGSTYKWEFVGGPALYIENLAAVSGVISTTYVALGPALTVPRPGVYQWQIGANVNPNGAGIAIFVALGTTDVAASDGTSALVYTNTNPSQISIGRSGVTTILTAGNQLQIYCRVSSGQGSFSNRTLLVTPVRVS